jgi:hypothetical protein
MPHHFLTHGVPNTPQVKPTEDNCQAYFRKHVSNVTLCRCQIYSEAVDVSTWRKHSARRVRELKRQNQPAAAAEHPIAASHTSTWTWWVPCTLFPTGPCTMHMRYIYGLNISYHESNMCCWSEILCSLSEKIMNLIQLYYWLIFALKLIIDKMRIY